MPPPDALPAPGPAPAPGPLPEPVPAPGAVPAPGPEPVTERVSDRSSRHDDVHVDQARIDVSQAQIVAPPASRGQAMALAYAVVVLFVVVLGVGAANLLFTTGQVHSLRHTQAQADRDSAALAKANSTLQRQIVADCGFYADLAGLPVTVPVTGGRPTVTLPRIISDSRGAFVGHGCPGPIPRANPAFIKWATYYHLPVYR